MLNKELMERILEIHSFFFSSLKKEDLNELTSSVFTSSFERFNAA
jgi:hypothetical protein